MVAGDGTVTPSSFGSALLSALGKPTSGPWDQVVNAWLRAESGNPSSGSPGWRYNNPLNTECGSFDTLKVGCWTGQGGRQFAIYPNLDTAVQAYTSHSFLGSGAHGYAYITGATTPLDMANAITKSDWDAGHYAQYTAPQYHRAPLTGIAALVAQGGGGTFPTGGGTVSGTPLPSSPGLDLNPVDWITKGFGGFLGNLFGTAAGVILNIVVLFIGIIFVVIGAWMLARDEDSTGKATRDLVTTLAAGAKVGGNATGDFAASGSVRDQAMMLNAQTASRRESRLSTPPIGADIKVEKAMGVPEQSPDTPRFPKGTKLKDLVGTA